MAAETGYQMSTSSVEHLLIVIIFGIFHIVTRDVHVPYNYDHRCVVYTAPHAAPLSSSVSPTAPPRGRDALMRWLIALLCFIEEKYDTLEQGTCTRPEENTKKNMQEQSEEQTKKNMQEQSEENTTKNMRRILKRKRKSSMRLQNTNKNMQKQSEENTKKTMQGQSEEDTQTNMQEQSEENQTEHARTF